jgi:hypothetical protein
MAVVTAAVDRRVAEPSASAGEIFTDSALLAGIRAAAACCDLASVSR